MVYRRKRYGRKRFFKRRFVRKFKRYHRRFKRNTYIRYRRSRTIGIPKTATVSLRYCTTKILAPTTAGLGVSTVFRCDSVYDPDYTGTGHQPVYRDVYTSMYNKYIVTGSKIWVKAIPYRGSGTATSVYSLGLYRRDHGDTTTMNIETMRENGVHTKTIRMGNNDMPNSSVYMTDTFSLYKDVLAKDREKLLVDKGVSPSTAGAGQDWVLFVYTLSGSGTAGGGAADDNIIFEVTIQYRVKFCDPICDAGIDGAS